VPELRRTANIEGAPPRQSYGNALWLWRIAALSVPRAGNALRPERARTSGVRFAAGRARRLEYWPPRTRRRRSATVGRCTRRWMC
jgi:hypothetical protein